MSTPASDASQAFLLGALRFELRSTSLFLYTLPFPFLLSRRRA